MAIRIQLRKDAASVWDSADSVLKAGEFGFAWDSADSASFGRLKIGDGSTSWTNLPYFYSAGDSAGNYASAGGAATWYGDRAVVGGGGAGTNQLRNIIDYYDMTTPGNATDFGDLTVAREMLQGAVSDATYGLYFGGTTYNDTPQVHTNVIDYITIATTGNATDFGDMTVSGSRGAACGDATYGVSTSITDYGTSNGLEYVTIASPGNASDFGDLTEVIGLVPAAMNDATYGVFAGGNRTSGQSVTIDYFTIATTGNASDFGDLTVGVSRTAGCSDDTYGIVMGGYRADSYWWTIDYVTIASPGNATDFGDLTAYHIDMCACSNGTYGNVNGNGASGIANTIEYVTIASPGNGTDFGDLTDARKNAASTSGSPS